MAASRRLARKLPAIISKHQRLISPEIETPQSPTASASIPLDPSLQLLPLAVSHLSLPSPLPVLPSAHASNPAALLRLLRRVRHHPRLAALDLHLLLAAASDSPAFRPDHRLTSLLAARLAASRRLPSLRCLLQFVLSSPCPCADDSIFACPELLPTFRKAILAFAASGDIPAASDALASLRRATDSPLPAEFYNIILHALARLRRHDDSIRFYGEMTSIHRVAPNAYTFNILVNSSCRVEGVDAAMRWFEEMRRRSCAPTGVSFPCAPPPEFSLASLLLHRLLPPLRRHLLPRPPLRRRLLLPRPSAAATSSSCPHRAAGGGVSSNGSLLRFHLPDLKPNPSSSPVPLLPPASGGVAELRSALAPPPPPFARGA